MIIDLPIEQNASAWTQRATLDGVSYTLEFHWNGRVGAWYLTIYDASGLPLLRSRKLATNAPLLSRFRFVDGLPAGELMPVDASQSLDYAGYSDLGPGRGVSLLYFEAATVAEETGAAV